jgi:t-SNARE complex subunit (syntaxin)
MSRFETAAEFARMVRDRRQWLLVPLLVAILFVLVFVTVAEMPVLIPFFYAVF